MPTYRKIKMSSLIGRVWGVQCEAWKGTPYAYGEHALWTGQVVRLGELLGVPGNILSSSSTRTRNGASCARCARLELRRMSSAALDDRQRKLILRSPDFWHRESGEVAWRESRHKLDSVDARMDLSASPPQPWNLCLDHTHKFIKSGSEKEVTPESVMKMCRQGQVQQAVEVLEVLVEMNPAIDKYFYYSVLKEFVMQKDLMLGGKVHALAVKMRLGSDTFLCNHFIRMYAGHGKLQQAMDVFRGVTLPDAFTWSSIISAHVKQGQAQRALALYQQMCGTRMKPDGYVLVAALKACAAAKDLQLGKQIHRDVVAAGLQSDIFVCNCLVDMYGKCGSLLNARIVFDRLVKKDVVTWNAMIAGYAKATGKGEEALNLYNAMHNDGSTAPDAVTFIGLLQACANVGASALAKGKELHSQLKDLRLESDVIVGGSLVNMYVKCGSLHNARMVFDGLGEKNVVTWNAMIFGYAQQDGMGKEALSIYSAMHNEGMVSPDAVTFVSLLQACASVGVSVLETGKQLHSQLRQRRLESDLGVGGSLVNMYVKCGSLKDARMVFDKLNGKNVITWTAMIAGYAQQEGMYQEALSLYDAMRKEGMAVPDAVTFVCLLQACANLGSSALEKGKHIHSRLRDQRLESDVVVSSSLVNMYVKCGSLEDARIVFDSLSEKNVVTWTAMIAGYAQQEGMGQEALNLYSAMHSEGIAAPNAVTFACLFQACANVGFSALEIGKELHSQLQDQRFESDVGGSLVNMYAKCGSLEDARKVFDGLREKHVVTWTAMISGYAQQDGMGQEALNIYSAMRSEGITTPDAVTYVCLLEACASIGALQQGKQLHSEIRRRGFESHILVGTCLVKMYAKCGCLDASREVFERLPMKDLVSWNVLLKGYADHGQGVMAIQSFEELLKQGIQPDEVTFTCLLTACSHAGFVDRAQQYFETMVERHGIAPNDQLYCCMVDIFGRSGHLETAEQMLRASGLAGATVSWTALLSACKSFGDAEIGRRCFDHLVKLDPTVATPYILLGSIHANAGRWHEVGRVESLRKVAGAKKKAAKASIEVKREVHEFTVGEERSDVAPTLRNLNTRVKEGGHVPQTQLVLRAVSERDKEDALCGHAEKLALAYGLLNTPAGSTLVVTKNLRMCDDCHSSTKIMSRLEKREIVVRDGHKVHRFENGACSCQDKP